MRTIKFRVKKWDDEAWSYYTLGDLVSYLERREDVYQSHTWSEWTGLHDKNGKEIYEGDILEGRAEVLWGDEEGAWVVAEKLNREITNHLWTVMAHPVEVIGNIYENPDLLK